MTPERFVFVIDTEEYAGSFERWMCGYMTGRYNTIEEGSTGHGSNEAKIAKAELPADVWEYFENHVIDCLEEPDDLPIHTPCVAYPTPGWFNHGMGGHFREGDEEKAYEHYKQAVEEYKKEYPNSTPELDSKLHKCSAYMSVGIFFNERPPQRIIEILKERARKFQEYWPTQGVLGCKLTITGFRIVKEEVKTTTIEEKV